MRRLTNRTLELAATFEPRGPALAITRSTLAFAELIAIVFTPNHDLFTYEPGLPGGMRCSSTHGLSLWCLAGPSADGLFVSRLVAITVLLVVVSGYRPRWTCVPHWFITCSLTFSMTLPNGGDEVAVIATMLLAPISLGDGRTWHWSRPLEPLAPAWAGSSYAAWCAMRCQIAIIYFCAAMSKLSVSQWRDGTAMYTVLVDPGYGLPITARHALGPLIASGTAISLLTWGVIGIELAICACALSRRTVRRNGVWLAVLLHAGIMAAMGLFSFGLIMMALVLTLRLDDRDTVMPADSPGLQLLNALPAEGIQPAAMHPST
jgi:antimicrobial peptide system SdpB family protein